MKTVHLTDVALLRNELTMLTLLSHPYLIRPIGGSVVERLIVLPLGEQSLYDAVSGRHSPIPLNIAVTLLQHIAEALAYIHRLGIMHRDLKRYVIFFYFFIFNFLNVIFFYFFFIDLYLFFCLI